MMRRLRVADKKRRKVEAFFVRFLPFRTAWKFTNKTYLKYQIHAWFHDQWLLQHHHSSTPLKWKWNPKDRHTWFRELKILLVDKLVHHWSKRKNLHFVNFVHSKNQNFRILCGILNSMRPVRDSILLLLQSFASIERLLQHSGQNSCEKMVDIFYCIRWDKFLTSPPWVR